MLKRTWTFSTLPEQQQVVKEVIAVAADRAQQLEVAEQHVGNLSTAVRSAVTEALTNHIKHGNQMDPTKRVHVELFIVPEEENERMIVESADEGSGFDPEDVPDPTAPENLERPCGRGLLYMSHYTSAHGGSAEIIGSGSRVRLTFLLRPRNSIEN